MNIVIKATTWTIGWSWMTLSRSHGWSYGWTIYVSIPKHLLLKGTPMPFYIRAAASKYPVMCVCKTHHYGQWSIEALIVFFEAED